MDLKIKGRFSVTLSKQRVEHHGDEEVLVHDAKVVGFVPLEQLCPILGIESEEEARGSLWDTDGDLQLPNVAGLSFHEAKFEQLCGSLGATQFSEATAKKFQLAPVSGGGYLTFQIAVPHPHQNVIGKFASLLGETHELVIEPQQGGLDLGDEEGAPEGGG